jgi:glycosyltransferase involved in cell wall biosynthesis
MKKIIIDARMINASGIGRYLQNILPSLIDHFDNIILLGDKNLLNHYGVSVITLKKPVYSVSEQLEFYKIIPECDIFFSPHYNIPLLPIRAKQRIVTIHDVFHLAFYKELNLLQKIYSKTVISQALKKSHAVITVSEFSRNEILKYTDKKYAEKISVIYNGVTPVGKSVTQNNLLYVPKSYFLFVGNIKPHKNLKRAVEAFRLFLSDFKESQEKSHFVIVGKKDGFITGDNIVKCIENDLVLRDYVKFTGQITDEELNILYSNALALVFPSYYEGFGFPPLEAMALNCPTIVSTAASMPEICRDAALYFNPFDITDLYNKMKYISNENLRHELIRKGHENIKRFSWEASAKKLIEIIEKLR